MIVCPNCGEENSERARFCQICAAPLATADAPPQEERRIVSILFVDLVGFTESSDRADPEDVRGTLVPFHRIAKAEIERHGGTLDKFIGDAAMGVFGVPAVHEDDPERAVRAALAIQEGVRRFATEHPGRAFRVRVGVETGEAVVTLATGPQIGENVVGDVVNTASRLQGVAPAGGVVVGEGAHRLTNGTVDYAPMEPVAVKGKSEPLNVWLAEGVRSTAAPAPSPGRFVGRDAELDALASLWAEVVDSGSARPALVLGEPGIGKSRLVAELRIRLAALDRLPAWRLGVCPPYGEAATFRAFADVLRAHLEVREADEPGVIEARLIAAAGELEPDPAERQWLVARLAPLVLPGAGGETDREELFGACERFLRLAARRSPVAVVIEDLHVGEPPMQALALHLARALEGAPVLVLCTAREELLDRDEAWRAAVAAPGGPALVRLRRLADDDVRALVEDLAHAGAAVVEGAEAGLVERAGGNPLFAREMVRMLAETREDPRGSAIPDTVQAVVAARLDALPPGHRSLVQAASVIGAAFWPDAVAAVSGTQPGPVLQALDSMVERGLVGEQPTSLPGHREFSFTHAVIRDVASGQMPRRNRAARHVAAARWIEEAAGEQASDRAEALAHHYSVAVELTRAAGAEPETAVLGGAVRFLALAGDRSTSLDAVRATEYYLQALDLLPDGDPQRPRLLLRAARFGRRSGRPGDQVVRLFEEAAAEFLERGDRAGAGEARVRLSLQLASQGQADAARAALREAIALLEGEPGARAELALAYATLGEEAALRGRPEEALEWSDRALAEPAADETRIMALQIHGDARCSLGDLGGLDDLRLAIDLADGAGLAIDLVVAHSWLAEWRWLLEGPEAGLAQERLGEEIGLRRGLSGAALWSSAACLGMLFDLGRWDEALELGERLLRQDLEAGGSQITGLVLAALAPVLVHRGRAAEALARQDEMLAAAREAEDFQFLLPALSAAVVTAADSGRPAEALALGAEFLDRTHGRATMYRELYGLQVVRACLAAGDAGLAERLADDMSESSPRQASAARTARALVLASGGRTEEALSAFEEAEAAWRAHGNAVEAALAALGAAECLAALGRTEEAAKRAAAAAAAFRGFGADALAAQADALAVSPVGD
jgi:class 3 adenylate cyclase/tetratricopeptide (TPR) repeat protein